MHGSPHRAAAARARNAPDADRDHAGAGGQRAPATRASAAAIDRDLGLLDGGGDRLEVAVGQLLGVGADDAGQPGAHLGQRRAAIVGETCRCTARGSGCRAAGARRRVIANSSEDTGQGLPPIGTCESTAATLVRSAPV